MAGALSATTADWESKEVEFVGCIRQHMTYAVRQAKESFGRDEKPKFLSRQRDELARWYDNLILVVWNRSSRLSQALEIIQA